MLIVAEAIGRGNSKTDGFKSRVVPVPKAILSLGLLGRRPVDVAQDILADIAAVDLALRNGLATIAAGGDREKVSKPHYARTTQARDALHRWADQHFFDALWEKPRFRQIQRWICVLWGLGLVGEAALRVLLVYVLPISVFLIVSPSLGIAAVALLLVMTMLIARRGQPPHPSQSPRPW